MKTNEIFVVIAYRWGNRDDHSYTVGAFTSEKKAIESANSHAAYRGGKYVCVVEKTVLDHFDNDDDDYTEDVYTTLCVGK